MSSELVKPEVVDDPGILPDSEIDHIVCCKDVHTTFCGRHVEDPFPVHEWVENSTEPICVECYLPARNPKFCPSFPVCVYAPFRKPG